MTYLTKQKTWRHASLGRCMYGELFRIPYSFISAHVLLVHTPLFGTLEPIQNTEKAVSSLIIGRFSCQTYLKSSGWLLYCRVPARRGLRKTALAPGSDETRTRDPLVRQLTDHLKIRANIRPVLHRVSHNIP